MIQRVRQRDDDHPDDDLDALARTFRLIKPFFGLQTGFMLGVLLVFWYCFVHIQYLPVGLDLGANILFAFIAIAMGLIYVVAIIIPAFILGGTGAFAKIAWKNNKLEFVLFCLLFILSIVFFSYMLCIIGWNCILFGILLSALLFGFGIYILLTVDYNINNNRNNVPISVSLCFVIAIFFNSIFIFTEDTIQMVFEQLGIRQENVSIQLSDMDYEKIRTIADKENLKIFFDCDNQKIVNGVNVLWHGVGTQTLIELPRASNDGIKLPVKAETTSLISGISKGCVTLAFPSIFKQSQSEIIENKKDEINSRLEEAMGIFKEDIEKVEIKGFTDKSEFVSKQRSDSKYYVGNMELAEKRADSVKKLLESKEINKIEISKAGAKYAVEKCDGIKNKVDLAECQSPDRKVEVKFYIQKSN